MRLTWYFIVFEAVTQMRSMRFRGLVAAYLAASMAPVVALLVIAQRVRFYTGPAAYNDLLLSVQPLFTTLLGAGLAVDALARERDEGSFSVLSVTAVSSAGYMLRRWFAIVVLCAGVSLLPTIAAAAAAIRTTATLPMLPAFLAGWLIYVVPALLVASALALALGTIAGRTILAIVFSFLLLLPGIGMLNDMLVPARLQFSGPGELFGGRLNFQTLEWLYRGYGFFNVPSDAGYAWRSELRSLLPRAGITTAIAILLLAVAGAYLRRTRRDIRPWHIPQDHQLRNFMQTLNRFREEFTPDSGTSWIDRATIAVAALLAVALTGYLVSRQRTFAALASERYSMLTTPAQPTSLGVHADAITIDASVSVTGTLRSKSVMTIRNRGEKPEAHLSFALNPMLRVANASASGGRLTSRQVWNRLEVVLDPPLAGRETRKLTFEVDGTPGSVMFNFSPFIVRWPQHRDATVALYMTDLSLSRVLPAATEVHGSLGASDLMPLLRYTPWTLDERREGFIPEVMTVPSALEIRLRHPYATIADACGSVGAAGEFSSGCETAMTSYRVVGGPFVKRQLGGDSTLLFLRPHESVAAMHAEALQGSRQLAREAWPGLRLPRHAVFVEKPNRAESEDAWWYYENAPEQFASLIGAEGSLISVPERAFSNSRRIQSEFFAAGVISSTLRSSRRVSLDEIGFFDAFYATVASSRLGLIKGNAVEAGTLRGGPAPDAAPLIKYYRQMSRMRKVLASIIHRVGSTQFLDAITEFTKAGPAPGTAKELLDTIGRRAGIDMTRTYTDYFMGAALPQLTLEDVVFRKTGTSWEVTGAVVNKGSGEAWVPIALRTSAGPLTKTLRVDTAMRVPFSFTASSEPRVVQIDPENVCYRSATVGLVQNVDYRGEQ